MHGAVTTLGVDVSNGGGRASDVVARVFAVQTSAPSHEALAPPLRQLVCSTRADVVEPRQRRAVEVAITPLALRRVDIDGNQWAEPSEWRLDATAWR
jgi:hypothetical protein